MASMMTGTCGKCDGQGFLQGFRHIANGRCFWCKGAGTLTVKESKVEAVSGPKLAHKTIWLPTLKAQAQILRLNDSTLQVIVWTPGTSYDDYSAPGGQFYVDLPSAKAGKLVTRGISCGLTPHRDALLKDMKAALKA